MSLLSSYLTDRQSSESQSVSPRATACAPHPVHHGAPLMLREKRARSLCSAAGTRPGVHSSLKTPFRILRFKFFSSKVPFCLKIQLKYFSAEDEYQSAAQLGLPLQRSAALPVRSTPWILSWFCKSANLWVIKVRWPDLEDKMSPMIWAVQMPFSSHKLKISTYLYSRNRFSGWPDHSSFSASDKLKLTNC